MNFGELGAISLDMAFLSSLFSIIIIDLVLAGDNAVVIAMAVRSLPKEQRIKGILYGAGAAVLLRVVLTFFVAELLTVSYVKLIGGLVILWIAVKLFVAATRRRASSSQRRRAGIFPREPHASAPPPDNHGLPAGQAHDARFP